MKTTIRIAALLLMVIPVRSDPLDDYFKNLYVDQSPKVLRKLDEERLRFLLDQVDYIDVFVLNDDLSSDSDKRFFLELEKVYAGYTARKRLGGEVKNRAVEVLGRLLKPVEDTSIDSFKPEIGIRLFSRQHILLMEASLSNGPSSAIKGRIGDSLFSMDGISSNHAKALIQLAKAEATPK
jgi:hypothetical protein